MNFRTKKKIPLIHEVHNPSKKGRPQDKSRSDAFLEVATYLEQNDDEQIAIGDLVIKMKQYLEEDTDSDDNHEPYTTNHMKIKLIEKFGDQIIIAEINSKPDVVTFKPKASNILNAFMNTSKKGNDIDEDKVRLVQTAAKLTKADIKDIKIHRNTYP